MKNMLVKFIGTRKDAWDEHIDACVFAYNTSRQESTLHSPFEVMFGRQAVLPVELDTNKDEGRQLIDAYIQEPKVSMHDNFIQEGIYIVNTFNIDDHIGQSLKSSFASA